MIAADVFTVAAGFCAFCIVVVLALAVAFAWREDHDRTLAELRHLRNTRIQVSINGVVVYDAPLAHVRLALGMMPDGETLIDEPIAMPRHPLRDARLMVRVIQP